MQLPIAGIQGRSRENLADGDSLVDISRWRGDTEVLENVVATTGSFDSGSVSSNILFKICHFARLTRVP